MLLLYAQKQTQTPRKLAKQLLIAIDVLLAMHSLHLSRMCTTRQSKRVLGKSRPLWFPMYRPRRSGPATFRGNGFYVRGLQPGAHAACWHADGRRAMARPCSCNSKSRQYNPEAGLEASLVPWGRASSTRLQDAGLQRTTGLGSQTLAAEMCHVIFTDVVRWPRLLGVA